MDPTTSPPCPTTATVRRNPPRRARATPKTTIQSFDLREIPPFPHDDMSSAQTPQPQPDNTSTSLPKSDNENLKVFLRIRPLLPSSPIQAPRVRAKSAWPQNPTKKNTAVAKVSKKKSSTVCLSVNDSQSVTLSAPSGMHESKRIKSETYGGFTHVFSSDSSQIQVYEKMVKPMVEEFLRGRSGMFAALGPSGSGKTHTVFGCPRDPGMVSLALRHIFNESEQHANQASRSFNISIFEIYTERGKAEKLFDLLPDGGELSMQQSTVRGLKEVPIFNAEEAESLIAQAVLKRATAMTNANSQSSRSQCIINIRDAPQKTVNPKSNGAVLTIIDLAGAEREKRTGNQGTRLLESNFINNTLMVFGLCLRSLLEHQKNPKKPLQKHFQSSMLTRYLRDYLEGKKRMALILTAKSGEEDYLDTSYLLRQASPYMQIKYNEVEPSNMVSKKRQYQNSSILDNAILSPLSEHLKRLRVISEHAEQNDEKSVEDRSTSKEDTSTVCRSDASSSVSLKSESDSRVPSERSHIIMQNFAKVIWNLLKQYSSKLKVAELEIESLKGSAGCEKQKYLELETRLNEFKACCICSKGAKVKTDTEDCSSVCLGQPHNWEQEDAFHAQSSLGLVVDQPDEEEPLLGTTCTQLGSENSVREILDVDAGNKVQSELFHAQSSSEPICDWSAEDPTLSPPRSELDYKNLDREVSTSLSELDDHNALEVESGSKTQSETIHTQSSCESKFDQLGEEPIPSTSCTQLDSENSDRKVLMSSSRQRHCNSLEVEVEEESKIPNELLGSSTNYDSLDPLSPKDVSSTITHNLVGDPRGEVGVNNSSKPPKPKRTLLPSSSMLSRDLSTFDLVDESDKLKGNRSARKLATHDPKRSNGSMSLLHLLQSRRSNLRL